MFQKNSQIFTELLQGIIISFSILHFIVQNWGPGRYFAYYEQNNCNFTALQEEDKAVHISFLSLIYEKITFIFHFNDYFW